MTLNAGSPAATASRCKTVRVTAARSVSSASLSRSYAPRAAAQEPRSYGNRPAHGRHGHDVLAGQHHTFAGRQFAVDQVAEHAPAMLAMIHRPLRLTRPGLRAHFRPGEDLRMACSTRPGRGTVVLKHLDVRQPRVGPHCDQSIAEDGEHVATCSADSAAIDDS